MNARTICGLLVALTVTGVLPRGGASQEAKPTFVADIMPLLNHLGCNQAKCHGASQGKGGLRLSLFGADFAGDYAALTKDTGGRRVNLIEPAESLVLLKVTAAIPHGGQQLVTAGSPQYNLLVSWLAAGAPLADEKAPQLKAIQVAPESLTLKKGESQPLQVKAVFADGAQRDVTALATFQSSDATVAEAAKTGAVTAKEFGLAHVVVGYLRQFVVARVVVPQPLPTPFPPMAANNKIDELVGARLQSLGLPPSELCSDQVFLRRVYLDVIGTLPKPDEVRQFLADADPQKRSKLIDRLLASEEFADYWALKWGDLFRMKSEYPSNLWPNAVQAFQRWIKGSFQQNKPYDQFARELIVSRGSNFRNPPANFYRAFLTRTPQNLSEVTALIFMGARMGCARCHGHPSERWTFDDDLGLAAFFAPIRYKASREWKEEIVYVDPRVTMSHPQTGVRVPPKIPGGDVVELQPGEDPRVKFADWLTAPGNPWFAKNIVNRTWFWLLGRGIVHDPDDLRNTNPPENPELLDFLEKELVGHKYDLKHIYRLILNSRTYQLSSKANEFSAKDVAHFSHYYVKRLGAETLLDAIGQVTARWDTYRSIIPEPFVVMPDGFRATHLADGSITLPFLELFGRPPRDTAYESDRDLELYLRQTLHLLNSSDVQGKISGSTRLQQLLKDVPEDPKIIEELYLATVSRLPSEEEKQAVLAYLSGAGKTVAPQVIADQKAAEQEAARVKEELQKANAAYDAAEKAAKEAEKVAATGADAEKQAAAEKRKAANDAKAARDKRTIDDKAASAKLAEANRKLAAATAALKPRRDIVFQDLLWALFNTKEFLFNH